MISPTVGRQVWVHRHESRDDSQPEAATIVFVHSDSVINVTGFSKFGEHFHIDECPLLQDYPDQGFTGNAFATWMPYQKGQAAKADALAATAAGVNATTAYDGSRAVDFFLNPEPPIV